MTDPDALLHQIGVDVDWKAVQERVGHDPERYAIAERDIERDVETKKATPPPMFVDWPSFCVAEYSEAEWDFEDVLARGRGHAIYAPAGHGKSLFTLWLSVEMMKLHDDMDVYYFDYEMTEADLHERLTDMDMLKPESLERLHYALLPDLPPLDSAEGSVKMMERIDAVHALHPERRQAVVVDTMGRAVAGEENDADTYRDFARLTGMALRRRQITWVRCDHAGKDPAKMQRGSSAKHDDVDIVWLLVPTNEGVCLKRDKTRMGWVEESVSFIRQDDPLRFVRAAHDWPAGTGEVANILNRLSVPLDATVRVAKAALKEVGEGRATGVVGAAIKYRRSRDAQYATASGNTPGNTGNTPGNTQEEIGEEFPF